MTLFKISFAPIIGSGTDKNGAAADVPVGRAIIYVVAQSALRIESVLKRCLPDHLKPLADVGFEIVETIAVPDDKFAWSVSVGPASRSYSVVVVASDQYACERGLKAATKDQPYLKEFVDNGLWEAFLIPMEKEGVA